MGNLLLETAKKFATEKINFNDYINSISNEEKNKLIFDLLELNLTDPNFSSLAEEISINICGYKPHSIKHGYDGYIGDDYNSGYEFIELKPQKTISKEKKLNGGGGYADYTLLRFDKDKSLGSRLFVGISGFVNGELLYIYKFPFNFPEFLSKIDYDTNRLIGKGKRVLPSFNYLTYKNCPDIELIFIRDNFDDYSDYLSKPFFNFVKGLNT